MEERPLDDDRVEQPIAICGFALLVIARDAHASKRKMSPGEEANEELDIVKEAMSSRAKCFPKTLLVLSQCKIAKDDDFLLFRSSVHVDDQIEYITMVVQ
jgi:hypothetical protein